MPGAHNAVSCIRRAMALQLAHILTETFVTNAGLVHQILVSLMAEQWCWRVLIQMTLPSHAGEVGDVHDITRSG